MFIMNNPYYETELGKLYCGDAKDILPQLEENSVDLVITDPPYPKEYFHCFTYLGDYCPRVMKVGSSLLTIVGHYQLEDVMSYLKGKLKYRWIINLSQFKYAHIRMLMGIEVTWKPMLWYVKEKCRPYGFTVDGIEFNSPVNKKLHKWQQSLLWCEHYINILTKENEIVLDPFMGSGTTAEACEKINRKWIGIEIEQKYCDIIIRRLQNELTRTN